MRECGQCAAPLPDGARFCPACGTPAERICSDCGAALVDGARFCMECGTPVSDRAAPPPSPQVPVASRRTTSILFGDLVGFTSLSEARDQEDVRELLSGYFEECSRVVARYGGTVEKFIGDAVMAVWGVPTALEDDAERAVRAGLELVSTVAELGDSLGAPDLAMRVGIVTGEVAVTVGATQQGMVAGDPVNTAARVQTAAEPGTVYVDETTRLLTSAAISYADAGSHQLKGKAEPMPLWSVRAVVAAIGGAQRADGLEAPLVGRDRELRLVKELFHRTEESGRPVLLVVSGEPGVGKSRVGWEFEKYVDGVTSTVRWHNGHCAAYGEGVAYLALTEAVRGRLQILADLAGDDDVEDDVLLDRGLDHLTDDPEERAWLRDRLGALLGEGQVSSSSKEDLYAAWSTFFERVAGDDPVVLLIDDAQHADEGLLDFVEHLVTAGAFACFVVLVTRPGLLEARPGLATHPRANVIHLPPLAARDLGGLLDGLVSGLPEAARDQLVERSEGIPLFAVEMVRSLIDRDLVVPRGGQYVLAGDGLDLDALAAPASLQALIAARLDRLGPEQRAVLDRASVFATSFSAEAITELCPDVADVPQALGDLVRLQLLVRESRFTSAEVGLYSFVQSAVRQVAYAMLSRRDRKRIHLAVVAHLERTQGDDDANAAIQAQHYLDALDAVPDDEDRDELRRLTRETLRRAARRASALGAPGEASRHLATVLDLTSDPAERASLGHEMAQALQDAGRLLESRDVAREAVELCVSLGDRLNAALAEAVGARSDALGMGDMEASLARLQPWWDELRAIDQPDEAVSHAMSRVGVALMQLRSRLYVPVEDMAVELVALGDRTDDHELLAWCYNALGISVGARNATSLARLLFDGSVEIARANGDLRTLVIGVANQAAAAIPVDLRRAVEHADEGVAIARRLGIPSRLSNTVANQLISLWLAGQWDGREDSWVTDQVPDEDEAAGAVEGMRALRAHARGEERELHSFPEAEASEHDLFRGWALLVGSVRELRNGDTDRARELAMASVGAIYRSTGVWDDLALAWSHTSDLAFVQHDAVLLADLLRLLDEHAGALPLGLRALRELARGRLAVMSGEDAEVPLRRAVDLLDAWGAEPYRARAQVELGQHLDDAALEADGRAVLEDIGANRWLADLDARVRT